MARRFRLKILFFIAAATAVHVIFFAAYKPRVRFGEFRTDKLIPLRNPALANIMETNTGHIPKILHYVFKDKMAFESYKEMIRSCLQLNPDWMVFLWTDGDSLKLIHEHYQYFEAKYLGYKDRLEKSDSVRYMILHKFGGVYLDMDVMCLKPFEHLLGDPDSPGAPNHVVSAFLSEERREQTRILYGYSSCPMNSLMGSAPGHPFFQFVINRMLTRPDLNHARLSTGPDFLARSYLSYISNCSQGCSGRQQVVVYPARLVSPLMDTSLVSWQNKCAPYFKPSQVKSQVTNRTTEEETWRRLGCAELVAKAWSFDDTDNTTVAVHKFTHQGYSDRGDRPTFDLLNEFPRVKTLYVINP